MSTTILNGRVVNRNRARETKNRPVKGQSIRMDEKRFGYFPQAFTWRGQRWEVRAVEQVWTHLAGFWHRIERAYFRVRAANTCIEGAFVLYQDCKANTWHIEKFSEE